MYRSTARRGFSLVELIVAVGLFTVVMTLASGAYLLMIGVNRQAQAIAVGINNLSFALETMTYSIRTGTNYDCAGTRNCASGTTFSFTNAANVPVKYELVGSTIRETKNGVTQSDLTDSSVNITSLTFVTSGALTARDGDYQQAHVTIIVSGTVSPAPGKPPESFTVEAEATMRGSDL